MLNKFLHGLLFGAGFAIAVWAAWYLGMMYVVPHALEISEKEPKFDNPKPAEIAQPVPRASVTNKEFQFFKSAENRMKIPAGGGILAMSPMERVAGSTRPSTYQLWLTHSELWQIRTIEDDVEIEKLPYPEGASVKALDSLMNENLGFKARQSTMTITEDSVNDLRQGGVSPRDSSLNGKLSLTTEGVVFVLPSPYET